MPSGFASNTKVPSRVLLNKKTRYMKLSLYDGNAVPLSWRAAHPKYQALQRPNWGSATIWFYLGDTSFLIMGAGHPESNEVRFLRQAVRLRAQRFKTLILYAGVAQLVERLICNQQVGGSSPSTSSSNQWYECLTYCIRVIFGNLNHDSVDCLDNLITSTPDNFAKK